MIYSETDLLKKITFFGVSKDSAELYLVLLKSGPVGIMDLSRFAGIGRNIVYKLLDELVPAGLVSVSGKSFGKEYSARQGDAFEALLASREAQLSEMRGSLQSVTEGLLALAGEKKSSSRIIHYEGRDGLEQVNWNMTKAKKEFRVYEQSHVSDYLRPDFAKKLRQRYQERGLISYDLTNSKKIKFYSEKTSDEYWTHNAQYRHIPARELEISFEIYIYDDVVTLLDYSSAIPHCIEIYNKRLAQMQRQIFDIVWGQSVEMLTDSETGNKVVKK